MQEFRFCVYIERVTNTFIAKMVQWLSMSQCQNAIELLTTIEEIEIMEQIKRLKYKYIQY